MQLVGSWPLYARAGSARGGGFGKPMDVAFDPAKPNTLFVPDMDLNCIWKIVLLGAATDSRPSATVTCFAGDCEGGTAGYQDGLPETARFNVRCCCYKDDCA